MSDPEAARYLLPDADNRRIFREQIVFEQFAGREPQQTPTVVVLLGQPGAGKTRVAHMLAATLNKRGGFIEIDSDLYKPYHPDYDRLMQRDDKLMAAYTRADGRKWMAQAHEYAREHKLNAVIQETSQDAQAVAATMRAYRDAGARVEIVAMGVSEAMSNQGIVNRYHEQVKERGSGRLTVQANADQSYHGILALADLVDQHHLAVRAAVFRRGEGEPRYRNEFDENGQWRQPPALRAAIENERAARWTPPESGDYLQVQGKLRTEMGPEWAERLDHIDRLAAPCLSPLTRLSDHDLAGAHKDLSRAADAAQRQAQLGQTKPPHSGAADAVERLAAQGASPEALKRARAAAREDRQHAASQGQAAHGNAERLRDQRAQAHQEIQRRDSLTPQQRTAEDTARRHLPTQVTKQQPQQSPPRIQGPRRDGPARGR